MEDQNQIIAFVETLVTVTLSSALTTPEPQPIQNETESVLDVLTVDNMVTPQIEQNGFSDLLAQLFGFNDILQNDSSFQLIKETVQLEILDTPFLDCAPLNLIQPHHHDIEYELLNFTDFADFGKNAINITVSDIVATIYENIHKTELQKVSFINDYFNQMPYLDDKSHWGVEDYWATPREFINSGGGDCEDYAIAKYITLKDLGVAESKLYLTYCKYNDLGHMFLSYFPTSTAAPLVLDNINPQLLPLNQRYDLNLEISYAINKNGIWSLQNNLLGSKMNSGYHWRAWDSLNDRLKAENYRQTYWI